MRQVSQTSLNNIAMFDRSDATLSSRGATENQIAVAERKVLAQVAD